MRLTKELTPTYDLPYLGRHSHHEPRTGGRGASCTKKIQLPVYSDPWMPGYEWKPSEGDYKTRCYVWTADGAVHRVDGPTLRVSEDPPGPADVVVSDAENGPQSKTVHYSLPVEAEEGYVAIMSRESAGRPMIYRQAILGPDLSAGVHEADLSDFYGKTIGEDLYGQVMAKLGIAWSTATDRGWLFTDGSGNPLPHGSPQWAKVGIGQQKSLGYIFHGKNPEGGIANWKIARNVGNCSLSDMGDGTCVFTAGMTKGKALVGIWALDVFIDSNDGLVYVPGGKWRFAEVKVCPLAMIARAGAGDDAHIERVRTIVEDKLGYVAVTDNTLTEADLMAQLSRPYTMIYILAHGHTIDANGHDTGQFQGFVDANREVIRPTDVEAWNSNTPHKLVFLSSCKSMYTPDAIDSLVRQMRIAFGADGYVGWNFLVNENLAPGMAEAFFKELNDRKKLSKAVKFVHRNYDEGEKLRILYEPPGVANIVLDEEP